MVGRGRRHQEAEWNQNFVLNSDIKEMEEMDIDVIQRVQATYVSHLFGGGEEARHREVKICYTITTAHSLVAIERAGCYHSRGQIILLLEDNGGGIIN
ncbi:hypothetical protein R1flu_018987 [Riccia fluitans]|uniref:Uncharacterized protein n=1 Tax=Riccia fluitans TaxID=41844 RepID=A0ABD1ZKT4_9MARC